MNPEALRKEYILCSAIYFDDGDLHVHQPKNIQTGFVICGRRHHNCYALLQLMGKKLKKGVQGFLTNEDNFVDRKVAAKIAFESGQIKRKQNTLISEDLW